MQNSNFICNFASVIIINNIIIANMKIGEIVYYCLDAIKAFSDDAYVNEDHVIFLLGKYRGALLQQYHNIKKLIPESNYQIVCVNLEKADSIPCTNGPVLKSIEELPKLLPIGSPSVLLFNGFESENIAIVPFKRLGAVGWNKWKKNFTYVAIGPDGHLYVSSTNPQTEYLTQLRVKGLFEDYEKAAELSCDKEGKGCDEMEKEFPLEVSLIPDLIARVVRDILGIHYRPAEKANNAADDMSDIALFIRQNMKKPLQKQLEGDE